LFASKPALKKKLSNAQGADKVKVVFDELVAFNTELVQSIDWEKIQGDISFRIEHLQEDITKLGEEWATLTKEKADLWIEQLSTTTDQIKADIQQYVTDLDQKHQLTEKLTTLGEHITKLKTKVSEITQ